MFIVFGCSVDDDISFGGNLDWLNFRVVLYYMGKNVWFVLVIFKSKCCIDIKYFLFDIQYCKMKFGLWIYDGFCVDVVNESDFVDFDSYINSVEWDFVGVFVIWSVLKYFCCEELFLDVMFFIIIC